MTNFVLEVVLDKYHWMLYFLVTAMYPRFLITLDEELNSIPVTVRVGQVCLLSPHFRDSLTWLSPGCRCRWTSWQATNNIWVPDTPDASAIRYYRASRTGDGGVHTIRERPRRFRNLAEESWVGKGRQDGSLDTIFCGEVAGCDIKSRWMPCNRLPRLRNSNLVGK